MSCWQYFKELYLVTFPQILTFTLLALFLQTMLSNKFVAHGLVIGFFILNIVLFNFGWENTLYLFGNTPPYTYSDMNGYGHFRASSLLGEHLLARNRRIARRHLDCLRAARFG